MIRALRFKKTKFSFLDNMNFKYFSMYFYKTKNVSQFVFLFIYIAYHIGRNEIYLEVV